MKPIVIKESNKDRIIEAIKEAEGRATARTINYCMIEKAIEYLEYKLGIPKKAMIGCKADIDCHAQDFPRSYKYTPESTIVYVEKVSSGWKIIDIYRWRTYSANSGYRVQLTDTAKEAIIASKTRFA